MSYYYPSTRPDRRNWFTKLFVDRYGQVHEPWFWLFTIIGAIVLVGGLVGGLIYAEYWADRNTCKATGFQMNREWHYDYWSDCLLKADNGRWLPPDAFKDVNK